MSANEYVAINAKAALPCKNGVSASLVGSVVYAKLICGALVQIVISDLVSLYPN